MSDLINNNSDSPLLSVITVVRNSAEQLEFTIRNIINQSFKDFEYIVIDGGSRDGTVEVLKKHQNNIKYWVSESDRGIYDAMNKGVKAAKGRWVIFMNAGDCFYDKSVIEQMRPFFAKEADIIYGSCEVRYGPEYRWIEKCKAIDELWRGMICCHQSMFTKLSLLKELCFDTKYSIASDYDFMMKAFDRGCRFIDTGAVVSSVLAQGLSDSNRFKTVKEYWKIARRVRPSFLVNAHYLLVTMDVMARDVAKKILPRRIIKHIILRKHKAAFNGN
jgi:glycosyltransferase involved in cell wall biosynthesis